MTIAEPFQRIAGSRDEVARRLLASSARKSYDPLIEIDWEAPVDEEMWGMTPEWVSLYGTPMWEEMTQEQRITLSVHEAASISATGIWFEIILMQMLIRDSYRQDPGSAHFQFTLTEIADECRHSTMFAKAADVHGVPHYDRPFLLKHLTRLFKATARGSLAYGGTLAAEEILDMMQRDFMRDDRVQPLTRTISKIHVLEESRHIRFAREETARVSAEHGWLRRQMSRLTLALVVRLVIGSLINPQVYTAAGLDKRAAKRAAKHNQHYRDRRREGCARTVRFLDECRLIGGPGQILLKRAAIM